MSTLKVNTLTDTAATKSVPIEDVTNGVARAWVNFNGKDTVAIITSYNVTSITDNGTGSYTVTFTNELPDADYCAFGSAINATDVTQVFCGIVDRTQTDFRVDVETTAPAQGDPDIANVAVFR